MITIVNLDAVYLIPVTQCKLKEPKIIMNQNKNLTVEELIASPPFKHALLVAGSSGLNKTVKWAHILDITRCSDYVNGGELILTTGAGWKKTDDPHIFLKELIAKNVTALCIQLGEKFNNFRKLEDLPRELIEEAERNDFPLIIFPEDHDCRYIDLMHNLHSMIINKDYDAFLRQETFINELNHVLINPHETKDILHFLHNHLGVSVAYLPAKDKAQFIPRIDKTGQNKVIKCIDNACQTSVISVHNDNLSLAYRKISAYEQDLGNLVLFSEKNKLNNFHYLVLEKCAIVLAQEYLGNIFMQEKEKQRREKWVTKWLEGRLTNQKIKQGLQTVEPYIKPTGVTACLVNYSSPDRDRTKLTESMHKITGIARTFFEQQGFVFFWQSDYSSLVYILVDTQNHESYRHRLNNALEQITKIFAQSKSESLLNETSFYIGKKYEHLGSLSKSLDNAKEAYYVQDKLDCPEKMFYEDLHIYRIILMLESNHSVEDFINDYLEPLIGNNHDSNKMLLKTLTVLRDCQYNKKEAAKKLFISRQSLYHRMKTLEKLLGEDFINTPEKRICLEIALYGYKFLDQSKSKEVVG